MKITYTSFDTAFNRHIRLSRLACKGLTNWERAEAIKSYFTKTGHPHPYYTFDDMAMNRFSDSWFPIDLMKSMAQLCAVNEEGFTFEGLEGRWHKDKCIGVSQLNDASVCLYSMHGPNSRQLLTVESNGKVKGYKTFRNVNEFDEFTHEIMKGIDECGSALINQIGVRLDLI